MKKLRVWLLAGLAVGLVVCEKPLDIGWIVVNSTPCGRKRPARRSPYRPED